MDNERNEIAEHAQALFEWRNVVRGTCVIDGALDLWLHAEDAENPLLELYCREALARIYAGITQGLSFWKSGDAEHGAGDSAAHAFAQAGNTALELHEVLEEPEQPLLAFLRLGMEALSAVGRDVQATIVPDDPF